MSLVQLGVLALVSLVLGLFVVRPILLSSPSSADHRPQIAATTGISLPSIPEASKSEELPMEGEIDDRFAPTEMAMVSDIDFGDGIDDTGTSALPYSSNDPVSRLRQLIDDRQSETVDIIRGWLEDKEEVA